MELATKIAAGIFGILALGWLLNPNSKAPDVISVLSQGIIAETQALQGGTPSGYRPRAA